MLDANPRETIPPLFLYPGQPRAIFYHQKHDLRSAMAEPP